jgi:hypothetical protein
MSADRAEHAGGVLAYSVPEAGLIAHIALSAEAPAPPDVMVTVGPSSSNVIQGQQSRSISINCLSASALPSLTTSLSPPGISSRTKSAVLNSFCHAARVSRSSSLDRVHTIVSDVAR